MEKNFKIILDFKDVKCISYGFANEVFGYFKKYELTGKKINDKIEFVNCSAVQKKIIEEEIK